MGSAWNSARQDTTAGRSLSKARCWRSVIPPQTPNSVWLSRESARHFGDQRITDADLLGDLLGGTPNEQGVGLSLAAGPRCPTPTWNELVVLHPGDASC